MFEVKILAFADFHGDERAFGRAKQKIAVERPELLIVAGDIANYNLEAAKRLLIDLSRVGGPIYFVPGNMDNIELGVWTGAKKVHALHGRCQHWENVDLIGLGGSPHGPFSTPFEYSEEEATDLLENAMRDHLGGHLILVSHCPPKGTKIDRVFSGVHAGSSSVRRFVEKVQPALVVSGHIHEAQGVDTIGSSNLVNTGPAHRGSYAQLTLENVVRVSFAKL